MNNLWGIRKRIITLNDWSNINLTKFYSINELSKKDSSPFKYIGKKITTLMLETQKRKPIFISNANNDFPKIKKENDYAVGFLSKFILDKKLRYQIYNFSLEMSAHGILIDTSFNFWAQFVMSEGSLLFPLEDGGILEDIQVIE